MNDDTKIEEEDVHADCDGETCTCDVVEKCPKWVEAINPEKVNQ